MSTLHSPVRNGSAAKPSTVKPSSFAPSSGGQRIPAALTGKLGGALSGPAAGARLHADPMADRACKDLDTAAFTVSNHVYLSQGRADLGQRENQRLLAHELAHVGQQSTMGEPMIQRSKETYTQVINYDELRKFADEKDKDKYENYIPDRAYRNERVAGRNYVDRNRGLSKSMDLYLDHVLDDLEAQQFFDPKNHEGLVKAYVDMVNGGAAKLAEICAEVEELEKNYAHTIDLLEGIRQSDPAVELRKKIKKLQRSYDKVSSRSHEALGGNSYKKMIGREKQYIAWEQRNRESGDESRADLFARKRTDLREGKVTDEGVRSGKGLNLVEQELGEIEREKSSAELQHQDMYREMIAMLGYAAIELEKAGKSVTEQKIAMQAAGFEFNFQKEDVKRRYSIPGRLRSMLTPYDEKAVAEDGAPLTYHRRPGCPKIKTSPSADVGPDDVRRLFKAMKIMPLIDAENPALLENVEQLLDADKDMFGEFVGAAVLELAGTKYKSAHGSWLDPRALLRLLIADQMMAQDPELAKTNTGEGKPVARNQRYNLSGSSLANLDLATNLSVGQAYAYLKQLRQQAGGNQDLFPDFAWAKVVVSTHLYMNDDIWAGAVGLADASGKKFINAEDLSFDMSAARKAAKTPAQKRWLRHIKAWPHDFDAWQNYASQENRATHTVNQAVCNEVAELTQAKCDVALPGGLKENAKWFADKTKGGLHQIMNADQDLWPCTSLFWLEWVSKNPGGSNSVDYRTNVSFFPDGAGGRHQLSSEGTYETEKYTYFLYKSGSEGPYNTSPECLAGTGQNCLLKRHDKGGKVEWAKWKHQATVAFPPHRDGVVTFEPEMPGQTHNISRLRWRGLSDLSEPHVMVGQDNGLKSRVQRPSQAALPKLYDLAHGQKVEDKRTIDYDSPIWKQILSKN